MALVEDEAVKADRMREHELLGELHKIAAHMLEARDENLRAREAGQRWRIETWKR